MLRAPGLPPGLAALAVTQLAYGGLLFTFTLYLQAGLGDSALRAGLTYLPMAAAFGLVGYFWRRLPGGARAFIVPAGLTVSALAYLGLAAGVRGGAQGGFLPFALAAAGLGLGLSVGPLLTQALAYVPPARAADASGLLTTTVQLGQLMGVAILGSVYLTRAATHPAATHPAAAHPATAHLLATHAATAMSGTAVWLAALSAAALPAALVMVRGAGPPAGAMPRSPSI